MNPIAELKESVDSLRANAKDSEQILVVDCLDWIVKVLEAYEQRLEILETLVPRA